MPRRSPPAPVRDPVCCVLHESHGAGAHGANGVPVMTRGAGSANGRERSRPCPGKWTVHTGGAPSKGSQPRLPCGSWLPDASRYLAWRLAEDLGPALVIQLLKRDAASRPLKSIATSITRSESSAN